MQFRNVFTDVLPADPVEENYVRQVQAACYSRVTPRQPSNPEFIAVSDPCAQLLGLPTEYVGSREFLEVFSGKTVLPEMDPHSMCYGGHQFGNWAGQLGDGRAIILGELVDDSGNLHALQLKGSGSTPYSRFADGLAVLRSSLREFVCSEAMAHLGVPTTRALSLIRTGDDVVRDILYDGNAAEEPGAIVCRVAPSFLRFGNFEILTAQQNTDLLKRLADYVIAEFFTELAGLSGPEKYVRWFDEVCRSTAVMINDWMRVGFVHGVMNTDNMSILSLTIDYGPYGWLEGFDPNWTPNTTDAATRRYRYGQQPAIAQWNLIQLANAIYPLIEDVKPLEQSIRSFKTSYEQLWFDTINTKLGLAIDGTHSAQLVSALEPTLQLTETDFTLFFRCLSSLSPDVIEAEEVRWSLIEDCFYAPEISNEAQNAWNAWLLDYTRLIKRQNRDHSTRVKTMNAVNPLYVPRNYLAQLAIDDATQGDYQFLHEWMDVLECPYTYQQGKDRFAEKRPEWARTRVGCSMLSCSS